MENLKSKKSKREYKYFLREDDGYQNKKIRVDAINLEVPNNKKEDYQLNIFNIPEEIISNHIFLHIFLEVQESVYDSVIPPCQHYFVGEKLLRKYNNEKTFASVRLVCKLFYKLSNKYWTQLVTLTNMYIYLYKINKGIALPPCNLGILAYIDYEICELDLEPLQDLPIKTLEINFKTNLEFGLEYPSLEVNKKGLSLPNTVKTLILNETTLTANNFCFFGDNLDTICFHNLQKCDDNENDIVTNIIIKTSETKTKLTLHFNGFFFDEDFFLNFSQNIKTLVIHSNIDLLPSHLLSLNTSITQFTFILNCVKRHDVKKRKTIKPNLFNKTKHSEVFYQLTNLGWNIKREMVETKVNDNFDIIQFFIFNMNRKNIN
jgi:hypothetical protein